MPKSWQPEHDEALKVFLANGLSHSEVADAMNRKFPGEYFTRNASIGRASRKGLVSLVDKSEGNAHRRDGGSYGRPPKKPTPKAPTPKAPTPKPTPSLSAAAPPFQPIRQPLFACQEMPPLREADVEPALISLLELEAHHCRWPIGQETILFCGNRKIDGSSYCGPHTRLGRKDRYGWERPHMVLRNRHRNSSAAILTTIGDIEETQCQTP